MLTTSRGWGHPGPARDGSDGRWVDCSPTKFAGQRSKRSSAAGLLRQKWRTVSSDGHDRFRLAVGTTGRARARVRVLSPSYYALVMRSRHVRRDREINQQRVPRLRRRDSVRGETALAPVTPEGRDALRRALVDERGALRVGRLVAMARTPAEHRTRRDVRQQSRARRTTRRRRRARKPRPQRRPPLSAVSALLLEERDGRALQPKCFATRIPSRRREGAAHAQQIRRRSSRRRRASASASTEDTEDTNRRPGVAPASIWAPEEAEMASAMARRRAPARRKRVLAAVARAPPVRRLSLTEGFRGGGGAGGVGVGVGVGAREGVVGRVCAARARADEAHPRGSR